MHESFINNLLAASLAGRTVSQKTFEKSVRNLLGDFPADQISNRDESDEDKEKSTITFADENPFTVRFGDQEFTITIRGCAFHRYERNFQGARRRRRGHHRPLHAERQAGDCAIHSVIGPPKSRTVTPLLHTRIKEEAKNLDERFSQFLKPTIDFNGVDFCEATPPWDNLGKMDAYKITSAHGWLSVDWNRSGTPCPFAPGAQKATANPQTPQPPGT